MILERFRKKYIVNPDTGCWNWIGSKVPPLGYGQFYVEGKLTRAHRFSYKTFVGDPGLFYVLHSCDNAPCVNPEHLFLGTQQDNMTDKRLKGRQPKGENHVMWKGGGKRPNRNEYARKWYQANKLKELDL
jgi:hypothetical protein